MPPSEGLRLVHNGKPSGSSRVADLLMTYQWDATWLTAPEVSDKLPDVARDNVAHALHRLVEYGLVERRDHRPVGRLTVGRGYADVRYEYRWAGAADPWQAAA